MQADYAVISCGKNNPYGHPAEGVLERLKESIVLQLNTRAKSLLLEEFPLAEKDLKREDGKWFLKTTIHSLEGAGRFVIGLAADVKIIEGDKLRKYILDYQQKHITKL